MQVYVCVKHVPDTAANIKLAGTNAYADTACKFIVNPYDEYAVEEALQLVKKAGKGEVVVVTVGKAAAVASVRSALAMGANRGILVKTDQQFLDSATTAQALKAAIRQDGTPDIILTGKTAIDSEGAQTAYRLAAALNLPVVNEVVDLKIDGGQATAEREIGGGSRQVLRMAMPCVIGATKGLNEPRYPKLPDILKAKKKPVAEIDIASLDLPGNDSESKLAELALVPERTGAKMLEGDVASMVSDLVRILKEEEKVLD